MDKSGKVFVTGATGFIGSSLTRQLLEAGYVVRGMSRSKPKAPPGAEDSLDALWNHPNFEYVAGDINDVDSLTRAMEGCRYAISLAGYARNFARDPQVFHRINVDGMRNVFAAAKKLELEKIVWTSTIVTFGPTKKGETGDENMPRITDKYYTEYEESKSVAEAEALQWVKKGLPLTIVNPTRVY
ncbi:MAG: NAD-dependent epimerase/dehydratase family protein, partial [Thermoguttaceae bacterium]|nr:NAD-dependent epimerase/dehydratase family protein [Thermoguttaceae bacterium]